MFKAKVSWMVFPSVDKDCPKNAHDKPLPPAQARCSNTFSQNY